MGSVFSGIAANIFNWRASFYLLAMIYVVFFVAAIWTVPRTQQGQTQRLEWSVLKKFDLLGVLLSITGIALFCSSLT